MAQESAIEWTDATWNPVRGCTRVSEGCRNCYAERIAARFSEPGQPYEGLAKRTPSGPRWTGKIMTVEHLIEAPLHWKKPRRIFVNSMSDLFHEKISLLTIGRIFNVMAAAHWHTFQVLTKRPENALHFWQAYGDFVNDSWPANVWIGVSVEDQAAADARIPLLLELPSPVRFLSCEPLLSALDLSDYLQFEYYVSANQLEHWADSGARIATPISWVIAGAESGPGARPMDEGWVRQIRDQCVDAGVAFFYKQNAVKGKKQSTPLLDGRTWNEYPQSVEVLE